MHKSLLMGITSFLAACENDDATLRPAGTVLHEVTQFTHGEHAFALTDETHAASAELTLGPIDGKSVRLGIDATLGVATVTYRTDGSRARRRVPRAVRVRLIDETKLLAGSSCDSTWNGPLADPPATLFSACTFQLGEIASGSYVVLHVFGDGQFQIAHGADMASVVTQSEPLAVLPP